MPESCSDFAICTVLFHILERVQIFLSGTHFDDLSNGVDEDLTVSDMPGIERLFGGLDHSLLRPVKAYSSLLPSISMGSALRFSQMPAPEIRLPASRMPAAFQTVSHTGKPSSASVCSASVRDTVPLL